MAYNASIQSTDSQGIKHLELMKETKGSITDSSTLSVVYLLSDSTQKAKNTASQALGASAPPISPSNLPGLKGAKKQELQKELDLLAQIQQLLENPPKNPQAFASELFKLLGDTSKNAGSHQSLKALLDQITSLVNKSGNTQLVAAWNDAMKQSSTTTYSLAWLSSLANSDHNDSFIALVLATQEKTSGAKEGLQQFKDDLNNLNKIINPNPNPNPAPSPSGDTVKTISFRALFAIMMKLMTSQENAQSRDADTGSKLSDQESDVITNMASSLSKYYNSVVAKADKTNISAKSAQLNLYKSEWDNFKDQIDGQVQNLSNAAGTTDVNNIQQTTDFEKDVLQTWGNVANQIAAL